jgi:branched-chain amino acid transport system substrate-binding protein
LKRNPIVLAAVAVGLALTVGASALAGSTRSTGDPGVTSTSILLGGTVPLSGVASAYSAVAVGANAYFKYVNAKGGVNGRQINYKYLDDVYNPATTVQLTRQLVEQDKVFAIFNTLGTETNLAIRPYLNQLKVPQLFAASGDTSFGADAATYPMTIGFFPSYQAEGWALGQYVRKSKPRRRSRCSRKTTAMGATCSSGSSEASPAARRRWSRRRTTR